MWLQPLISTFPLSFSRKSQREGLQQTVPSPRPPRHQSTLCARTPGSLMGERSPPPARRAPRQPILALPWPSHRLPRSVNLRLPPGRWAMATPRPSAPSPAPGGAHSNTSDSAWRIPMEQGCRPPGVPTAPVIPSLFSGGGGPLSASNPRAASSPRRPLPRRPRAAAYRGWLPHRRPRSPSGCLAWWQRRAGPGDGCAASPAPLCPPSRLSRSL